MLARLGYSAKRRRRKPPKPTHQATPKEATVSEIYFPPRNTQLLREMRTRRSKQTRHLALGFVFDLTTNDPDNGFLWSYSTESKRDKARVLLREQKPYLLIGSPMCTAFRTTRSRPTRRRWNTPAHKQCPT